MSVSNTGTTCAVSGVLTRNGSDLQFCNGTHWISANGAVVASCSGTTAGTVMWKAGDARLEWCDGTNWNIVGADDPCAGKSIGQTCAGTTALYAGVFDGGKYMVMPSGCADDTSDPTCSGGADTVKKSWNDGSSNYSDVAGVTNIGGFTQKSSSAQRGHYTTPLIAAITDPTKGGLHAAARFCNDMVYGGYDDW